MKIRYDLHIHSALSPCAEDEMTPNNIVNMAILNGINVIAVTDHNSAGNVRAVVECGEKNGLVVVPGIEVETVEEVHICCLFPTVEGAEAMDLYVREHLMPIENKEDMLGKQQFYDSEDICVGVEKQMLLFAASLTIEDVLEKSYGLGGCGYFAHVDRGAYSVLSVLGGFPPDSRCGVVEITDSIEGRRFASQRRELEKKIILFSSDSHRLADIGRNENYIEVKNDGNIISASDIIDYIRDNNSRRLK